MATMPTVHENGDVEMRTFVFGTLIKRQEICSLNEGWRMGGRRDSAILRHKQMPNKDHEKPNHHSGRAP